MKNKTKAGIVFLVVLIIASILIAVDMLKPVTLNQELEFWDVWPKEGTEYMSEEMQISDDPYFVYSAVSEGTGLNGKDEYVILIGKKRGIGNKSYDVATYWPQADETLETTEYLNIYNSPEKEIKKGSNYFGSLYVGTVPANCTSIEIQGVQATMVKQSFTLNGNDVSFYLYYCIIEEPEYPDKATVIVTDMDGSKYSVYNADGGEYPILTKVNSVS